MPIEIYSLVAMTLFFAVAWLPSSIAKYKSFGLRWLGSNRTPLKNKELIPWGGRAERAHNNLKDNFPAFVVAILTLAIVGKFDEGTKWAALIYVTARLFHFIVYLAGMVPPRALFYFTGLISNLYLLVKIVV